MALNREKIQEFVDLVNKTYPNWSGFLDPRFVKDEIEYKQATIAKAKKLLSKIELRQLIEDRQADEFINRLEKIGKDNNLLWLSVPMKGDLGIIYQPELDKVRFCDSVFDLLYGEGLTHERLRRYAEYVKVNSLPNKWTFPTYFLFICHPDTEMFVKPRTTKWFVQFAGGPKAFTSVPTPPMYVTIKQLAQQLQTGLKEYGPRDMVDIQSLIWVCAAVDRGTASDLVTHDKKAEFAKLFEDFVDSYALTPQGQNHITTHREAQEQGRKNFEAIRAAADRREDVTERVLLELLPYSNLQANRERGAWISSAPALATDVRVKFEAAKWTNPEDWPRVATAILSFVRRCAEHPEQLLAACNEFSKLPYTKGFQMGMLTPILNALRPDDFLLINNKPRRVVNYFSNTAYGQQLADYPAMNTTQQELIEELVKELQNVNLVDIQDADRFDMFCHWLVAVQKFSFKDTRYWKIAPGEEAWNWEACRDGGFIAIGWDELGDISDWKYSKFERLRDELVAKHEDWKKAGVNQVWEFAHIREGDRIIANHGTSEVLGIGTVTGSYTFVPGTRHGHRLPVEWQDAKPRKVNEGGWRRALIKIDQKKFEEICSASPEVGTHSECPFSTTTFDLLADLHSSPTRQFYHEHREEFRRHVEEPFRDLLRAVAKRLPASITDRMETEKRLFARVLKNDFGRGGAWDFYWGAFYNKGSKRTEDAQLFLWINRDRLEFGFYIGEYGSNQRKRFLRNCRENRQVLVRVLQESLPEEQVIVFGEREGFVGGPSEPDIDKTWPTLEEWLVDPGIEGIHAAVVLSREKVLQHSSEKLSEEITGVYQSLFPFFLLATLDQPMDEIRNYLVPVDEPPEIQPAYPLSQCSQDTNFDETLLESWVRAIQRKGQVIIYGPPGTGKTHLAEHLARHLIGGGDGFYEVVQFHPAYAYEDFIQGIRPQADSDGRLDYPVVPGRFLKFCMRAKSCQDRCVLIIDEVNRAHLSRVFGELMYLLEYRDQEVPLAAGGVLRIPENVRIIGTMNTADRSIALVDHALRRRFAFLALYPNYDVLRRYHEQTGLNVERLIDLLSRLNDRIDDKHYEVGITFFLREDLREQLRDIWKMEIEPYLEEYFFNHPDEAKKFNWDEIEHPLVP